MFDQASLGLDNEQASFNALGRALYILIQPGDTRIEYEINLLHGVGFARTRVFTPAGQKEHKGERYESITTPFAVLKSAQDLRAARYREGNGTWFSAKIVVTAQGSASAEYNYDTEPEGFPGDVVTDPAAYVEDQEFFPRNLSAQPEWLRQRLAEGQASIEASGNKRERR